MVGNTEVMKGHEAERVGWTQITIDDGKKIRLARERCVGVLDDKEKN